MNTINSLILGRYLTSAAGGSNSSSTSNPAAPSPGSRPSAFSPTQTYQQQQAQAVAGTSAQAATPGGLQAVAAAGTPVAGTNPFWSPFSSYYPFLLHSAAAYHQQAAAASMPTASLTALQHYHHQLLMLHAQQVRARAYFYQGLEEISYLLAQDITSSLGK